MLSICTKVPVETQFSFFNVFKSNPFSFDKACSIPALTLKRSTYAYLPSICAKLPCLYKQKPVRAIYFVYG